MGKNKKNKSVKSEKIKEKKVAKETQENVTEAVEETSGNIDVSETVDKAENLEISETTETEESTKLSLRYNVLCKSTPFVAIAKTTKNEIDFIKNVKVEDIQQNYYYIFLTYSFQDIFYSIRSSNETY